MELNQKSIVRNELWNWMKRVTKEGRFNGNRQLFRKLRNVERQGKKKGGTGERAFTRCCLDRKKISGEKKREL
jgi:hypothetical protein